MVRDSEDDAEKEEAEVRDAFLQQLGERDAGRGGKQDVEGREQPDAHRVPAEGEVDGVEQLDVGLRQHHHAEEEVSAEDELQPPAAPASVVLQEQAERLGEVVDGEKADGRARSHALLQNARRVREVQRADPQQDRERVEEAER